MGPYAGVAYNLTLSRLRSRLRHVKRARQPYARVDLNPVPDSTLSPTVRDFGFGLGFGNVAEADASMTTYIEVYCCLECQNDKPFVGTLNL